jgi:hypothetical protein
MELLGANTACSWSDYPRSQDDKPAGIPCYNLHPNTNVPSMLGANSLRVQLAPRNAGAPRSLKPMGQQGDVPLQGQACMLAGRGASRPLASLTLASARPQTMLGARAMPAPSLLHPTMQKPMRTATAGQGHLYAHDSGEARHSARL